MEECKNLDYIIKDDDLNKLFDWVNIQCDCIICKKYDLILNILDDEFKIISHNKDFLENDFKKINLTDNMRNKVNNEISNKILIKKIFKIIKD